MIATSDLMAALVGELDVKNKLLRERVMAALSHLAPDAGCESRADWKRLIAFAKSDSVIRPKSQATQTRGPK